MRIHITADFSQEGINKLEVEGYEVTVGGWGFKGIILTEDQLIQEVADKDILIVGYEPVTQKVFDKTHLKVICSIRGGPQANIDIKRATALGIPVLHTSGREAIPVADFTMGQIISLARRIVQTDRELHRGKFLITDKNYGTARDVYWDMSDDGPWMSRKGIELNGKTLGLIGFGTVGVQVSYRARVFGLEVLAYDPYQPDEIFIAEKVRRVNLDELLQNSDIVSIHAMANPDNQGMLGHREFSRMKNGAYFINNARASIVDEKAMRDAIMSGKLGGVALDVHHHEPFDANDPLLDLDNVILTPHIAGAGLEVKDRHSKMIVDDLLRLLRGERPRVVYNPETLEGLRYLKS